jgi:hypothetical protein
MRIRHSGIMKRIQIDDAWNQGCQIDAQSEQGVVSVQFTTKRQIDVWALRLRGELRAGVVGGWKRRRSMTCRTYLIDHRVLEETM